MKHIVYPKNKQHFKKLILFAKRILLLCKANKILTVIYGSYAHFYYTKDENMKVNDIDIMIHKKDFLRVINLLEREKIKFKYYPKWETCVIKKGKLRIEVDSVGSGYRAIKEKTFFKESDKIDFYGTEVRIITLKQLEEIYSVAYNRSREDKAKILNKIKSLEKSLGRKLKSDIQVEIVKNKNLSKKEKNIINSARLKNFGKTQIKDFSKDYEPDTLWFFVKKKKKVVSLGGIRPLRVKYLGKTYNIGGICSTISLIKRKGYGKMMVSFLIDYSRRTGKTILGFTGKTEFFKKAGLGAKNSFIGRFVYLRPDGEKVYDNDGDGIYYEGKDKFISKVLKTKSPVYTYVEHW